MEEELLELLLEQLDGYFDYLIWEYTSERTAYIYDSLDRTRLVDTLSIPNENDKLLNCYSLTRQMAEEHSRQGDIARLK